MVTVSKEPIVKGRNIIDRWVVDLATPPEMIALREAMRVDFGRFDYVLADGGCGFRHQPDARQHSRRRGEIWPAMGAAGGGHPQVPRLSSLLLDRIWLRRSSC
ncbi:MAG TPA: hypothetical protein VFI85_08330 [Methyloceanibacter sp.]|nr:hypothetical protein [Methyloceanibacter sp.]